MFLDHLRLQGLRNIILNEPEDEDEDGGKNAVLAALKFNTF